LLSQCQYHLDERIVQVVLAVDLRQHRGVGVPAAADEQGGGVSRG
jgi:hypothetical protein